MRHFGGSHALRKEPKQTYAVGKSSACTRPCRVRVQRLTWKCSWGQEVVRLVFWGRRPWFLRSSRGAGRRPPHPPTRAEIAAACAICSPWKVLEKHARLNVESRRAPRIVAEQRAVAAALVHGRAGYGHGEGVCGRQGLHALPPARRVKNTRCRPRAAVQLAACIAGVLEERFQCLWSDDGSRGLAASKGDLDSVSVGKKR